MKALLLFFCLAAAALAQSKPVMIVTEPSGAEIYEQTSGRTALGRFLGRSGEPIRLAGEDSLRLSFRLEGFEPVEQTVPAGYFLRHDRWPANGALQLQPASLTGWLKRYPVLQLAGPAVAALLLGLAGKRRRRALRSRRIRELTGGNPVVRRAGGYLLVETIGTGGASTVYRGVPEETLGEERAVKIPRPECKAEFRQEIRVTAGLSHPNIVRVLDFGEDYLVLELMKTNLRSRMGAPMQPEEALRLLQPVADALQYAHDRGVVHGDLKPENILLNGRPKLSDFGMDGRTPAYMAPEQWSDKPIGPWTDQYSLGVLLYELVTGRLPFDESSWVTRGLKQLQEPPPRPEVAFADALMRMLEPEPEARFPSLKEAFEALEK